MTSFFGKSRQQLASFLPYSYACSQKEKCGGEGVALLSLQGAYPDRIDDRADDYCDHAVSKCPLNAGPVAR